MVPRPVIRATIVLLVVTAMIVVTWQLMVVIFPFLFAYILIFGLRPLVTALEQRGMGHTVAVFTVFIASFAVLGIVAVLVTPPLLREVSQIHLAMPQFQTEFSAAVSRLETAVRGSVPGIDAFLGSRSFDSFLSASFTGIMHRLPNAIVSALPILLYIIIVPFVTLYVMLDGNRIKKKLISAVPNRYFEVVLNLFHNLHIQFGMLLAGMVITVLLMSILISIGLWVIGLKYPIIVGIFSGAANLIPYAGPVVGIVCAVAIALLTGAAPLTFLHIVLVFAAANLVENVIIQPMVLGRAADLHPLLVIFLILLGSQFGGVVGMLLIIPIASLVKVAFRTVAVEIFRPSRPPFSSYRVTDPADTPS